MRRVVEAAAGRDAAVIDTTGMDVMETAPGTDQLTHLESGKRRAGL
jgi:hypothetical protein